MCRRPSVIILNVNRYEKSIRKSRGHPECTKLGTTNGWVFRTRKLVKRQFLQSTIVGFVNIVCQVRETTTDKVSSPKFEQRVSQNRGELGERIPFTVQTSRTFSEAFRELNESSKRARG